MTPLHHTTALIPSGDGGEIEVELSFTMNKTFCDPCITSATTGGTEISDDLFDEHEDTLVAACWSALSDHHETNETDRAKAMADARAEREMGL